MATSLRSETDQLVRLANRDLARLWDLVSKGAAADEVLSDLLPAIVREYGAAGGALAAEWYDRRREHVGAKGRFTALPIEPDDRGAQSLTGWALETATDDATLRELILGGTQRRIADHVRLTVVESSLEDPASDGWQRDGSGECDFCTLLINRGAVYSESSADFAAHDNCRCGAEPAFGGFPRPVRPYTSPITEVSAGNRPPPEDAPRKTHDDKPLTPMERMARALSPAELLMETKRGSANAQRVARSEMTRRGLAA